MQKQLSLRFLNRGYLFLFIFLFCCLILVTKPSSIKMAEVYLRSYEVMKSLEELEKVVSKDPDNIKALKLLKTHSLNSGDIRKALKYQERLLILKPLNYSYYLETEKLYDWNQMPYKRLQVMEGRSRLIEGALKKENLLLEVAEGYRWLRKYEDADRVFAKLEGTKRYLIVNRMADYYLVSKQPEKLKILGEKYKPFDRNSREYLVILAKSYEASKEYQLAIETNVKLYTSRLNEAVTIDDVFDHTPDGDGSLALLYRIDNLLDFDKKYRTSYRLKKFILKHTDSQAINLFHIIEFLFDKRLIDIVNKEVDNFVTLYGKESFIKFKIAQLYEDNGYIRKAIDLLKSAIESAPLNLSYHEKIAALYEQTNESKKALKHYYKVLEIEKNRQKRLKEELNKNVYFFRFSNELFVQNSMLTPKESSLRPTFKKSFDLEKMKFQQKRVKVKRSIIRSRSKIDNITLKIADLHEKNGEVDRAIKILDKNKKGSSSKRYKAAVARRFIWYGRSEKAIPLMENLPEKYFSEEMLTVYIEYKLKSGKQLDKRNYKFLENKALNNEYFAYLYYNLLKKKEPSKAILFCEKVIKKSWKSFFTYECFSLTNSFSQREKFVKDRIKEGLQENDWAIALVGLYLEKNKFEKAYELLPKYNLNKKLRSYLEVEKERKDREESPKVTLGIEYDNFDEFSFSVENLKVDRVKKFFLNYSKYLGKVGSDFTFTTYELGYRLIGEKQSTVLKLKGAKDKEIGSKPFSISYDFQHETGTWSFLYDGSALDFANRELFNAPKSYFSRSAISHYLLNDKWQHYHMISSNSYIFNSSDGVDTQLYSQNLIKFNTKLMHGPTITYIKLSGDDDIKNTHIQNSLSYAYTVQYQDIIDGMLWRVNLNIGGDIEREIGFGSLYDLLIKGTYNFRTWSLEGYGQYSSQTVGNSEDEFTQLGFNLTKLF